jgi:hypothetical protein
VTDKVGIVFENDPNEKIGRILWSQYKTMCRIARGIRDYSKPVDEYFTSAPFAGPCTIVAAYSTQVRIESVTASLPVGITSAVLQLADRFITLYSGGATTVQTLVNWTDLGMILVGSDERILTFAGAPTSGIFIALNGHQLGNDK